tara:strand:- start:275 stop:415 length:141 start_codon:yes stop_codon:yes gene_type:complete
MEGRWFEFGSSELVEGRNLVAGVVLGAALEDLVLVSVHCTQRGGIA